MGNIRRIELHWLMRIRTLSFWNSLTCWQFRRIASLKFRVLDHVHWTLFSFLWILQSNHRTRENNQQSRLWLPLLVHWNLHEQCSLKTMWILHFDVPDFVSMFVTRTSWYFHNMNFIPGSFQKLKCLMRTFRIDCRRYLTVYVVDLHNHRQWTIRSLKLSNWKFRIEIKEAGLWNSGRGRIFTK